MEMSSRAKGRDPSFDAIALDLASDIGDNRPYNENQMNMQGIAGSVNTHFHGFDDAKKRRDRADREKKDESNMMSRLVLTRMNTLEEGFRDILKEVKDWRSAASSRGTSDVGGSTSGLSVAQRRLARKIEKEKDSKRGLLPDAERPQTALRRDVGVPSRLQEEVRPMSPATPTSADDTEQYHTKDT